MFKKIVGLGFKSKGRDKKNVASYIKGLVLSGANEFFTGYNPSYWSNQFGFEVSPNGRFAEHEQITDFETLKEVVLEVHKHNIEIFVNLNSWYYTDKTIPSIKKMVEEFESIGVDGIICGNIGILEYLKSISYRGKINISTIMSLYNKESIKFLLENYKINKVILSREITLKEIEEIVNSFKNVLFEVFGEGDFCRYNNGLCFAEHKYGAKDFCTVVVNDLLVKKRFLANFKKLILDKNNSEQDIIKQFDNGYIDDFELIGQLVEEIELGFCKNENNTIEKVIKLIRKISKLPNLFFDAYKPILDNKKILNLLLYLKFIENHTDEFKELKEELEKTTKSGMEYYIEKLKKSGYSKLKAEFIAKFYSRSDNLNLYSYLFFSKFDNIDTVKFPTRGRNYNEKIKIIEDVLIKNKIDTNLYFDRGISIGRTHYDLEYIFGKKLWFRKQLKEF